MRLPLLAVVLALPNAPLFSQQNPSQELEQMTKRYKLNAEQQKEIKPILESEDEDLEKVSALPPSQRDEKTKETRALCNREIEGVLHAAQRQLFDRDNGSMGARR
jgi:hypothetical protein